MSDASAIETISIDATKAKNTFGALTQQAKKMPVHITRHGQSEVVMISTERFERMERAERIDAAALDKLDEEFDTLVAAMQSDKSRRAVDTLLDAPIAAVVKVANRRRGR